MYSIIVVLLLSWSPAVNLGIPGVDDMHPQSVRWQAQHTCLVWETNIDGDWEIFSRFLVPYLPLYTDTIRITDNTTDDFFPVVAYDETRQCFWCAWQGSDSGYSDIFVCCGSTNSWSVSTKITNDPSYDGEPSICVIKDTVWVAWYRVSGGAYNIFASFYDGVTWSSPMAITNDSVFNNTQPRINGHYNRPLVVWEREDDDIYYSEYISGVWQSPMPVTTDPASDMKPEIAVVNYASVSFGSSWIFWYSDRDGNCEIYSTAMDTFNINHRVTFNDSTDYSPSPLDFIALINRREPTAVAYVTTRHGNYDIYANVGWYYQDTVPIDTFPSLDLEPCMSGGDWYIWIFWTTDRNGDLDICGSYEWVGGIEENAGGVTAGDGNILTAWPNPFVGNTLIKFQIPNTKYQTNSKFQTNLEIYDAAGRTVKVFNHSTIKPLDQIIWDGTDDLGNHLAPGVYFCTLRQGGQAATVKLIKTE